MLPPRWPRGSIFLYCFTQFFSQTLGHLAFFPQHRLYNAFHFRNSLFEARGSCHHFVTVPAGNAGLGDRLGRFFLGLSLSQRFVNVTFLPDNYAGKSEHSDGGYEDAVSLALGLNFSSGLNLKSVNQSKVRNIRYSEFIATHDRGEYECGSIFSVDIYSCSDSVGGWCPHHPEVRSGVQYISWVLKSHTMVHSSCSSRATLFTRDYLSIVLHLRTLVNTDFNFDKEPLMCENCNERYMSKVKSWLANVTRRFRHKIYVLMDTDKSNAWDQLLKNVFPDALLITSANVSMTDTICHLLNADLLITTGSSFSATLSAFSSLSTVVEEANFISSRLSAPEISQYVNPLGTGFHMRNGTLMKWQIQELIARISMTHPLKSNQWNISCVDDDMCEP